MTSRVTRALHSLHYLISQITFIITRLGEMNNNQWEKNDDLKRASTVKQLILF